MNKRIKRVSTIVLGDNQYFGEKEVLAGTERNTQAKVISANIKMYQLSEKVILLLNMHFQTSEQIFKSHFQNEDTIDLNMQENQLKEIA